MLTPSKRNKVSCFTPGFIQEKTCYKSSATQAAVGLLHSLHHYYTAGYMADCARVNKFTALVSNIIM